jgi:hypothetical protein
MRQQFEFFAHFRDPSLLSSVSLSFEIDSNEVMDEHFPALCTPQPMLPLLRRMPQETVLDPGVYGWSPCLTRV